MTRRAGKGWTACEVTEGGSLKDSLKSIFVIYFNKNLRFFSLGAEESAIIKKKSASSR